MVAAAVAVVLCWINKTALIGFEIQRLNLHIHRCVCGVCIRMSFAFCHSFYGDCWCWWFRFHWSKLVSKASKQASKQAKQVCLPSSMRVQNWICKILNVSLNKSTHPVSFSLSLSYFGRFCSRCFVLPLYACVSLCDVCAILYLGRVTPKVNILCEVFFSIDKKQRKSADFAFSQPHRLRWVDFEKYINKATHSHTHTNGTNKIRRRQFFSL